MKKKSVLDKIIGTKDVEPPSAHDMFWQIFTECRECQEEWQQKEQWYKERGKEPFIHWSIVCCQKHAIFIRQQLNGKEENGTPRQEDLLNELDHVRERIDKGLDWMWDYFTYEESPTGGELLYTPPTPDAQPTNWGKAEEALVKLIERECYIRAMLFYGTF